MLNCGVYLEHLSHDFCCHHLAGITVDRDRAMVKDDDPVGEVHCQIQIVKDRNDCRALAGAPLDSFNQIDLMTQIGIDVGSSSNRIPGP